MTDSQLSQDEIDSLLDGVAPDDGAAKPWAHAPTDGIDAVTGSFDIATAGRFGNGRLPTLALINERFTDMFAAALHRFTGRRVVVTPEAATVTKYGTYVAALEMPSSMNIVRMGPSCGHGLFTFDSGLLYFVIDSLFGGDGSLAASKTGRTFTTTEQRLITRLCELVFQHYCKAWEPVHPMQFELHRSESETRFVNLTGPDDAVLVFSFGVDAGNAKGCFRVCMPLEHIDPIRDLITREVREKTSIADSQWSARLAAQVSAAEVELVAELASVPVTCKELLAMKVGDVIVLDIKPTITAAVDGVPVLRCRYGNANGRYSIRVEEIIRTSLAA